MKYDVLIVGGGIMGSSLAYHLMKFEPGLRLAVVERDPTYVRASTTLSLANVRLQFTIKENILISKYALEILETFEEDMAVQGERPCISFHREGNLILVDEAGRPRAEAALGLQQSLDCPVAWLDPSEIQARYPLYRPEGLVGGTFGSSDGHLDAYAVLQAYKAKAREFGAVYLAAEAKAILRAGRSVAGVALASGERLESPVVANCAGAWAGDLAKTAGVELPLLPISRQVFAFDPAVKPAGPLPLTFLTSGLYFRNETGGLIVAGKCHPDDPVGYDFSWDRNRFIEYLWPDLAGFVPAFESLKIVRGWAGLYSQSTLDSNAILGPWPELKGLFLANGFSGHGLQQGPAVGRYLAELILGKKPWLDLSVFGPERILENRPLLEGGIF